MTGAQVDHQQTHTSLKFEVATVKPVDRSSGPVQVGAEVDANGVVRLNGYNLKGLITAAYGVSFWQIAGTHGWMDSAEYNVVGKPPEALQRTGLDTRHTLFDLADPRMREMVRALLADRFQLKLHETTEIGKVYFLKRNGKQLALHPYKAPGSGDSSGRNGVGGIGFTDAWTLSNMTMQDLADYASTYVVQSAVIDQTGLSGAFDFHAEPESWEAHAADRHGSFLRLLNTLGLKLEPGQGEIKRLVVDHADVPSPD
ncbi:TIGR03435 family protein [Acidipila sp. EB88]|uniref:TIGR03435 family protein n=1 Tax=Acidipila sp. EB88 TaxID=2305226 RepID=UPI001F3AAC38|nr:TIGR03435 family protein [Acidipila sp. EB88]